jgi:DNA-binding response OmpR family regulator
VLVVDDDASIRDVATQALVYDGYDVLCAADGADAITVLAESQREPFDLILLDWRMPTPAAQFVHAYRRLPPPHAPIVVLSGGDDLVEHVEEIGASGFLLKPFDLDALTEIVGRFAARLPKASPPNTPLSHELAVRPVKSATVNAKDIAKHSRTQRLIRLRDEVTRLRTSLASVREDTRRLLDVEAARPLSPQEAQQLRTSRRESERLRWELQLLWQEFEQVRQQ